MPSQTVQPEATITRVGWCQWAVVGVSSQIQPGWPIRMRLGTYLTQRGARRAALRWVRRVNRERAWAKAWRTVS